MRLVADDIKDGPERRGSSSQVNEAVSRRCKVERMLAAFVIVRSLATGASPYTPVPLTERAISADPHIDHASSIESF